MTAQPVLGKTTWMIADGYMSDTVKGEFVSHEAVCVLNLSGATAHIDLTLFFEAHRSARSVRGSENQSHPSGSDGQR